MVQFIGNNPFAPGLAQPARPPALAPAGATAAAWGGGPGQEAVRGLLPPQPKRLCGHSFTALIPCRFKRSLS
ncbi:MAG: hypothetical protein JWR60_1008 [Polaromonas sp.]|nr:hypothetical protein [Polaromonas sp.]